MLLNDICFVHFLSIFKTLLKSLERVGDTDWWILVGTSEEDGT